MSKVATGQDIIKWFEEWSPKQLAFEGDPVGLHVGTLNKKVNKVMVTLDVLESVVDEAIENNVDLIIAHHPLLFKPLKQVSPDNEKGRIVQKLIKHDITVYAAHTNLDVAWGGVNDAMCEALGVNVKDVLIETQRERLYKVVVFVPQTHEDKVREALGNAGAGHIGNYSHCTFQTPGIGAFKPEEGTDPYIGTQGEIEKVDEVRMETIVPQSVLKTVLKAMEEAHPYEEVAYDVYPLELQGEKKGLGRMAELDEPMTLESFAERVKDVFDVPALRLVGDKKKTVKNVAVLGGDGNKYISAAKRKGADVFVTGDLYFHVAHDALGMGLNVIDPGHHVEKVMKKAVHDFLKGKFEQKQISTDIMISEAHTEPFQFM
ncbi:Nif3-like dinuclear metal center hexameric protein [Pontibacillus sp. ALD_SL1]|uniref:Nif3-like dinuclear metal center hexameric protein n=1 Tax=Pontibacillus sp. ALD_SL1 TaxID=2777185 RepID=UPI001A97979E|nr:Nif3-like dinuclear metal center hexameric protein [Pontibacillus sp. ALD_SL1]QSS98984.1 Nif3-like dinuclear metal center hexameric protein [Pontibacillus sp. ALD_SL1]